jgi:O-acetylhomoserine/O-acetylserine sulfhydrylase-like pyridoxal-dependent enzyme
MLLFRGGEHLVVTEDLYGGTYRLFERSLRQYGLDFAYVDITDLHAVRSAIRPETRALFVESLTNPILKAADIGALAALDLHPPRSTTVSPCGPLYSIRMSSSLG